MGYLFLAALAAIGFLASVACHVMGWMQINPPIGQWVFALHGGIFIVWFPLVFFANRAMPKGAKDNVQHLLAQFPKPIRNASTVLFVYAILHFFYFIYCTSRFAKGQVPFYLEVRGFSGHWMLFYGMATLGFIGLAQLARKPAIMAAAPIPPERPRCPHCFRPIPTSSLPPPTGLALCPKCGFVSHVGAPEHRLSSTAFLLTCPSCRRPLPRDDINVATNAAICSHCREAFRAYELFEHAARQDAPIAALPRGVQHRILPDGWDLEITCRSPANLLIVPFTAVWISVLVGATVAACRTGAICCMGPVLLLFYWAAYMLCWTALMAVVGKTTLRVRGDNAELSNGIGRLSRRQRFQWSTCRDVEDSPRPTKRGERWQPTAGLDVLSKGLHFEPDKKVLWWGQMILENRRDPIRTLILSHLAYQGTRVPLA